MTATVPNQIYSWDSTYLATGVTGLFYYRYLLVDIFSRNIAGRQVYNEASRAHAAEVIKDSCRQENSAEDQVTLPSDTGGPMQGATRLTTLQKLGVLPALSRNTHRPSVSNDTPYSASLFDTLKYRPNYPNQTVCHAGRRLPGGVEWYNHEPRHSRLQLVTPAQRHAGNDQAILTRRKATYRAAEEAHPSRWRQAIRNWDGCSEVSLNPDNVNQNLINAERQSVH